MWRQKLRQFRRSLTPGHKDSDGQATTAVAAAAPPVEEQEAAHPDEHDRASSHGPPTPSLEGLPFELQEHIIMSLVPSLEDLSALVRASPQLHRVYAQGRLHILRRFLEQSFGDMLVDTYFAYHSGTDSFQQNREEGSLWEFLNEYQHTRATTSPASLATRLSLEEVTQMANFHMSIIEPLTDRYAAWALAALLSSPEAKPLSQTERRRIQRGLYHLEIVCNVCGSKGEGRSKPDRIEGNVARLKVLALFPGWQVEELLCVHAFAQDKYSSVFHQVAWDLNEERNLKYRHIDMNSVNEDLLLLSEGPEQYINDRSLNAMLRHGLPLLSAVFKTTNHDDLVELVRASVLSGMGAHRGYDLEDWLDDAVILAHQDERRGEIYTDHDAAQDSRQKTPFEKDTLDGPPLAWARLWNGEACNLFGAYLPKTFRRWGYIMWDATRLDASGAGGYMEQEFRWKDWDPREDYYVDESENEG